ncbi:MAG: DUF445 family protein [Flammeovirgaceae bacterium]|nr:DUF445 family protein [Flammeovirgaceae bacterium]
MVLYIIPFISAAIGWFTNYVALKMLFHPREKRDFGLFKLQGIFPKRKPVLAERLGRIVARDLFSAKMISEKLDNGDNRDKIKETILVQLDAYLRTKFKESNPMIAMFLNDKMIDQFKDKLAEMLDELIPKLMNQMTSKVENIDIEKIVHDRVNNFSNEKLESLLMAVIKKELKFIELAGAVLGFVIGIIQVGIIMFAEGYSTAI